jgi:hypothetical protein
MVFRILVKTFKIIYFYLCTCVLFARKRNNQRECRCCFAHLRRSRSINTLSYNFNLLYFLELFQTLLPKKYEYKCSKCANKSWTRTLPVEGPGRRSSTPPYAPTLHWHTHDWYEHPEQRWHFGHACAHDPGRLEVVGDSPTWLRFSERMISVPELKVWAVQTFSFGPCWFF